MRLTRTSITLALGILLSVTSCNDELVQKETSTTLKSTVEATQVAHLGIDGMFCQAGCAYAIEESLSDLKGVTSAEVNYSEKMAAVSFDDRLVSKEQIIAAIQNVNDNHYTVVSSDLRPLDKSEDIQANLEDSRHTSDKSNSGQATDTEEPTEIAFPNIFDVLIRVASNR